MAQLKTREQVLEEFDRKGISITKWSRDHGLNPSTVRAVLKCNRKARIGESHKAAVMLGIKAGELSD
jgi:gp16 family phage-associated protein